MSSVSHANEFDLETTYGLKGGVTIYDTWGDDLYVEEWEGYLPGGKSEIGFTGGLFMTIPLSSGDSVASRYFFQLELMYAEKWAKYLEIPLLMKMRLSTTKLFGREHYNSIYTYAGPAVGVALESDAVMCNVNTFDVGFVVGLEGNHLRTAWGGRLIIDLRVNFGFVTAYEESSKPISGDVDFPRERQASERNLAASATIGWGF
jgi:hypothetical protein